LSERLHVVRDRGKVGKWLDRERGTLTPRHGERDGDRLVDVRDVGNPQPAHLLAAVAHAGVAVDREPTPGPLRGVRAPCRREHPADALSGLERLAGELHQLDVHGLLDGALRNLRDRYRLGACQVLVIVLLGAVRGQRIGYIHQNVISSSSANGSWYS